MPDLRTVLTETQRAEIRDAISAHRLWNGRCEACGAVSRRESDHMADVVIETLAGLPGVAVTQLPEPSHAGTVSTSFRHVTYWHSVHQVRGEKRLITVDDPGRCMSADEARVLAADLLAAAAALSVEGNTHE